MALRREFAKRLVHLSTATASPVAPRRSYLASPDNASRGLFRRFLQRRAINQSSSRPAPPVRLPEFLSLPVGDKLREKLSEMTSIGRLDGLAHLPPAKENLAGFLTVEDVRRIARAAQLEKVKQRLRSVPENTVSYSEFVQICAESCGSENQGLEFAKLLDDTVNVIVLGDVVFLRPEQVAKSVESLIWESWAGPNDPRRKELEEMEEQKAQIDKEAQSEVMKELYGGLGLMVAQTVGFMRLTFWELSWDVMEPICFFVGTMHFAMAYAFFLRTSTEPSFEGFFRRRFQTKQAKLMRVYGFDVEKYERLSKAVYPTEANFNGRRMSVV